MSTPTCPSGIRGKAKGTNAYRCRDCRQWHTTSHPTVIKPRRGRA